MKLLCFIDNLGSGGAQRQLATLAVGLKKRGHEVRFLVYHPHDHFLPVLVDAGIPCQVIRPCSHWRRVFEVRRVLRAGWQDVVLAFLDAPCLYAELARIPVQGWGLVAGERSADPGLGKGVPRWLRQGHRLADSVVTNSHTNRLMLQHRWPFLKNRLSTIYNTVDLRQFRPGRVEARETGRGSNSPLRIVVAARYEANKNLLGVAKALVELKRDKPAPNVVVDWYGGMPADLSAYDRAKSFVAQNGLEGVLNLHPATKRIGEEFARASAVGLFSFFEGLPNVICEGMACGKPILMSNVCDAGSLVHEGRNGFLCDPATPASIANSIWRLSSLGCEARQNLGTESRRMAELLFDQTTILDLYERVLNSAIRREPAKPVSVWPPTVPESAVNTLRWWQRQSLNSHGHAPSH
jgi:glycosyltransferase involved in cell wall biosynthesis